MKLLKCANFLSEWSRFTSRRLQQLILWRKFTNFTWNLFENDFFGWQFNN